MMGYSDLKELLKDAKNLAEGAHDLQLKEKLLDIQGLIYELQDENRELRIKLHEMNNINITESELIFREGVYLKGKDVFCSACWDKNKDLVRVRRYFPDSENRKPVIFRCDVCNEYRYSDIYIEELSNNKITS